MGLFGQAGERFKRTMWKNVQNLADELWGVFTSNDIDLSPRSLVINQAPGATIPPIVINQPEGSAVAPIQVNNGGTVTNIGGGDAGGGGGGIDLGNVEWPGQEPGDADEATPPPAMNPIPLHGRVAGKVGGQTYSVRCWARSPLAYPPIGVLEVEFPDVDPAETIPVGTRCPVIMFPQLRYNVVQPEFSVGYVPVFLAPEA